MVTVIRTHHHFKRKHPQFGQWTQKIQNSKSQSQPRKPQPNRNSRFRQKKNKIKTRERPNLNIYTQSLISDPGCWEREREREREREVKEEREHEWDCWQWSLPVEDKWYIDDSILTYDDYLDRNKKIKIDNFGIDWGNLDLNGLLCINNFSDALFQIIPIFKYKIMQLLTTMQK